MESPVRDQVNSNETIGDTGAETTKWKRPQTKREYHESLGHSVKVVGGDDSTLTELYECTCGETWID